MRNLFLTLFFDSQLQSPNAAITVPKQKGKKEERKTQKHQLITTAPPNQTLNNVKKGKPCLPSTISETNHQLFSPWHGILSHSYNGHRIRLSFSKVHMYSRKWIIYGINGLGFSTHPDKLIVCSLGFLPTTLKLLSDFESANRIMIRSLTDVLKKNSFHWTT